MIDLIDLAARLSPLTRHARTDVVRSVLADETDYDAVLGGLPALLSRDPAGAGRLAASIADAAGEVGLPAVVGRARYVEAQGHMARGDLPSALAAINLAERSYREAGRAGAALRTNLGRIHVLNEMGRHEQARAAADTIIQELSRRPPTDLDARSRTELAASAHQNLGLCFELTSQYAEALVEYAAAEAGYKELGDRSLIGMVANDRGLALMALGRIFEALSAFGFAAGIFTDLDEPADLANTLTSLAEAQLLTGQYPECLDTLRRCGQLLADIDVPIRDHDRLLVTARAYEALNLFPEAQSSYQEAANFFADAEMTVDEARARWGLGRVAAATDRPRLAEQELIAAGERFGDSNHGHWSCGVLLDRCALLERGGRFEDALALARQAGTLAAAADVPIEAVRSHISAGRCLDALGRPAEAAIEFQAARQMADLLGLASVHLALDHVEGLRHLAFGEIDQARELLGRVADAAERMRSALGHDAFAASFMADKGDVLQALVSVALAANDGTAAAASEVLAAVERARSRGLAELTRRTADAIGNRDGQVSIVVQQELAAIYNELLAPGVSSGTRLVSLRDRATELELRLSRMRLEQAESASAPTGHVENAADAVGPAATQLKHPVLSWYCLGNEVVALMVRSDSVTVRRHLCQTSVVTDLLDRLDSQWDRLHLDPDLAERHAGRLLRSCRSVLHELYNQLIAPIADLLPMPSPSGEPLAVVAHGALHRLPVQALYDGERYLVEGYEIVSGPSLGDLAFRDAMVPSQGGGALVVGVSDDATPGIVAEVRAVAAQLTDVALHLGAGATAELVLAAAPGRSIIHLACHALFRHDNPMFSSLRLADRWLAAHELSSLDLEGSLVVISACDGARSRAVAGEELLGLTRAVLGAGARTLVAARWAANDAAAAEMMREFYSRVGRSGPAAALRAAQLDQSQRQPHPYYWAPFAVFGGR